MTLWNTTMKEGRAYRFLGSPNLLEDGRCGLIRPVYYLDEPNQLWPAEAHPVYLDWIYLKPN